MTSSSLRTTLRAGALPLALAALASMAVVDHPKTGWGVNTRLALIFAVVDEGRFTIDSYHRTPPAATNDKAFYEGHYYSDKIFGVSLLALPLYAAMRAVGLEPDFRFSNWALRVFAVSIPAALSLALLWALLVRGGGDPWRAWLAVALVFWGSMWFGFSTAFFPYPPGILCALAALWWILWPRAGRITPGAAFAIGLACGYAMLCDMTFGLLILALVATFAWRVAVEAGWLARPAGIEMGSPDPSQWPRVLAAGAIGGLLPLAPFFAYTYSIFGRLSIPYEYVAGAVFHEEMSRGFMGITRPHLGPLWFITLHPYRGLFFWTPVLAAAAGGLVWLVRRPGLPRLLGALGLWGLASYLTFNAAYYMWWGGWAMGARHLLPAMAVLPLGLLPLCRADSSRRAFGSVLALGALGVVLSFPVAFHDPETPVVASYADLRFAEPSASLRPPQFDQWRSVMGPRHWRDPSGGWRLGAMASFAGAALAPLAGGLLAHRRLRAAARAREAS